MKSSVWSWSFLLLFPETNPIRIFNASKYLTDSEEQFVKKLVAFNVTCASHQILPVFPWGSAEPSKMDPGIGLFTIIFLVFLCIAGTIALLFCIYCFIWPQCAETFGKPTQPQNKKHRHHPDGVTELESTCPLPSVGTSHDFDTKIVDLPLTIPSQPACPEEVIEELEESGLV